MEAGAAKNNIDNTIASVDAWVMMVRLMVLVMA